VQSNVSCLGIHDVCVVCVVCVCVCVRACVRACVCVCENQVLLGVLFITLSVAVPALL
jgi:hypothetical protein